ncbi:MAG TPA: glucosaminidase domain-containing protein [Kouleothrix sp.]|uniref:glucosaminidase domain-containing protein n=1 Tax=Kouleothrix sp. TaxID=2779161 RepID=UPI002BFBF3D0|nr:glucosaminidase domain-containing protein [Kouleothrix sp.]HRC74225.1 glucosaminidase domain-containing protein [Kouleothrix sp.]
MSADAQRRQKPADRPRQASQRAPMFEVRHDELPQAPRPIDKTRDLFEDLHEIGPRQAAPVVRTAPRQPAPLQRLVTPQLAAPGERDHADAPAPRSLPQRVADLQHTTSQAQGMAMRRPYQATYEPPGAFIRSRPWLLIIVALVSVLIIWFASATPKTIISGFNGGPAAAAADSLSQVFQASQAAIPAGEHSLLGTPSISAQFIDQVLAHYGSPAQGTGAIWVEMGQRYGIDPAYALAFFIHESSAGTNPGWAGLKPGGGSTHNVGNIICAGYATCFGRFRDYASWDEGIEDWYKLIATEYVGNRGTATIEQIIPIYAPSFENDVGNYVATVVDLANAWRQGVVR